MGDQKNISHSSIEFFHGYMFLGVPLQTHIFIFFLAIDSRISYLGIS